MKCKKCSWYEECSIPSFFSEKEVEECKSFRDKDDISNWETYYYRRNYDKYYSSQKYFKTIQYFKKERMKY